VAGRIVLNMKVDSFADPPLLSRGGAKRIFQINSNNMAKRKKHRGRVSRKPRNFIVVTTKSYGNALKGTRIYFEGKRPKGLKDDGSISFGKHTLEALKRKFDRFRWIITEETDSIREERGIVRVRTSRGMLGRMGRENWDRSRDIKNDIVRRFFSIAFPDHFEAPNTRTYVPGTIAAVMDPNIVPRLSSEDKEALASFLPDYLASESIGTVQKLKASAQIETLKALAKDLETEMPRSHPESWWQTYIKSNILLMQQGYIKAIEKLNVAIGDTKFPDFCLVTHDNYLDILEIKKPDTGLLKQDVSRGNFYWDPEVSKAIIQTENYIEHVSNKASEVRSYLLDKQKINIKAVRPRGIILAGDARSFSDQKQRDDFRLLSQGIKSISVVTYDELLNRLNNYIGVLEEYGERPVVVRKGRRSASTKR
jgi:hypothetical protein